MHWSFLLFVWLTQLPPIGGVDSEFDKTTDFAALRSYAWTAGTNAFLPEAHKMIVAAVDAEMASLGLKQVASGADITVAYYALTTTQVDFKALDKLERDSNAAPPAPTKELGKLIVIIRNPARQQLWSAGTREFLEADRAKLGATIRSVTARLFATYPGRGSRK
jgi:Domain of unknown function (DUF4136)